MTFDFDIAKRRYPKLLAIVAVSVLAALFSITTNATTVPVDSSVTPRAANPNSGSAFQSNLKDVTDTTHDAPYGVPYLLETGYANVNKRGTVSAVDQIGKPGSYMDLGCQIDASTFPASRNYYGSGASPNKDLPYCRGIISTTKTCPKVGFTPVVKFTPSSITSVSYTPIFACHSPDDSSINIKYGTGVSDNPNNLNTSYIATFVTPAMSANKGTGWDAFVSVKWEMWCYPTKQRTNSYGPGSANVEMPTYEACNIATSSTLDTAPVLWDVGNIAQVNPTPAPQTFQTNRRCPVNWGSYIILSDPSIQGNDSTVSGEALRGEKTLHESMGPNGICILQVTDSSTSYTVKYMAKATIMETKYDANEYTLSDPSTPEGLTNAHWQLYCYPPNLTAPTQTYAGCDAASAPYR